MAWNTDYGQVKYTNNGPIRPTGTTWEGVYGEGGQYAPDVRDSYVSSGLDITQLQDWARTYARDLEAGKVPGANDWVSRSGISKGYYQYGDDATLTQAKLAPRRGESEEAWADRLTREGNGAFVQFVRNQPGYEDFRNKTMPRANTVTGKTADQTVVDAGTSAAAAEKSGRDDLRARIQKFSEELTKPLDLNDPEVKTIVAMATNASSNQARLQGIQGPLSVSNTEHAVANAGHQYNLQRQQLGLSALGLENQADLGAGELAFREKEAARAGLRERFQSDLGAQALQAERAAAPWRTALGIGSTLLSFAGGVVPGLIAGGANLASGLGSNNQPYSPASQGLGGGSAVYGAPGGFSSYNPNRIGGGSRGSGGLSGI